MAWAEIGSGTAAAAREETRRTLACLASIRAADGGAAKVWKEGDVPAPAEADAREVLVARPGENEWQSEVLEAPAVTVLAAPEEADESAPRPAA